MQPFSSSVPQLICSTEVTDNCIEAVNCTKTVNGPDVDPTDGKVDDNPVCLDGDDVCSDYSGTYKPQSTASSNPEAVLVGKWY